MLEKKRRLYALLAEKRRREALRPRFAPHPGQAAFVESDAKFRCFNGGFGAGKTFAGAHEAWRELFASPGVLMLIVAPTYPELRDYTQRTFFAVAGTEASIAETHPLIASFNKTEQHLRLTNGSEVLFRSADKPSSLVGSTIGAFWIDEPASCSADAWRNLIGRLRAPIGSLRGWCTGTPAGHNWVWREFAEKQRPDYALFTASTHENADNLPPGYIDSMVESYAGVFARANIYGEFTAFEGQVYQFSRDAHVLHADWTPEPDVLFDRAADFGTNNPTAWLWVQEIAGTVYVFDELEVRRTPVPPIAQEVRSRWPELEHAEDFGDIAGTQRDSNLRSYVLNYEAEGIRIRTRPGGAVKAGVEVVTRYLAPGEHGRPRLMVHPRCERLIAAFETYRWAEDKSGIPVGEEPLKDGVSDHLMDALRYWFVNRHPEQFRRAVSSALPSSGGSRGLPASALPSALPTIGPVSR